MAILRRKISYSALHATVIAAISLMAAQAYSAVTPDFCTNVKILLDHTSTGFAGIITPPGEGSGASDVTLELNGAESCTVATQLEGRSYHCIWKFPYRADAALAAFTHFNKGIQECIGERAKLHNDQDVNHPDFYDLRLYELDHAKLSVSLKDKRALDSTFVFIRVSP